MTVISIFNLHLLVFCRYVLAGEWLDQIFQYVYFLVHLLEDLVPPGRVGYYLMAVATKEGAHLPLEE